MSWWNHERRCNRLIGIIPVKKFSKSTSINTLHRGVYISQHTLTYVIIIVTQCLLEDNDITWTVMNWCPENLLWDYPPVDASVNLWWWVKIVSVAKQQTFVWAKVRSKLYKENFYTFRQNTKRKPRRSQCRGVCEIVKLLYNPNKCQRQMTFRTITKLSRRYEKVHPSHNISPTVDHLEGLV